MFTFIPLNGLKRPKKLFAYQIACNLKSFVMLQQITAVLSCPTMVGFLSVKRLMMMKVESREFVEKYFRLICMDLENLDIVACE